SFSHLIEARLHGERDTVLPRVFARPLELRRGQTMTDRQLIDRLNDLGYAQREKPERPGEFAVAAGSVSIAPRPAAYKDRLVSVLLQRQSSAVRASTAAGRRQPPPRVADRILEIDVNKQARDSLTLDAPVLTALISDEREKRRPVALGAM